MAAPGHDWYFADWLGTTGKTQADIIRATGWPKSKVSKLATGRQPYDRDTLNLLADVLNLAPFEMLMHPEDAMRVRRLRDTALSIAADNRLDYRAPPAELANDLRNTG